MYISINMNQLIRPNSDVYDLSIWYANSKSWEAKIKN